MAPNHLSTRLRELLSAEQELAQLRTEHEALRVAHDTLRRDHDEAVAACHGKLQLMYVLVEQMQAAWAAYLQEHQQEPTFQVTVLADQAVGAKDAMHELPRPRMAAAGENTLRRQFVSNRLVGTAKRAHVADDR